MPPPLQSERHSLHKIRVSCLASEEARDLQFYNIPAESCLDQASLMSDSFACLIILGEFMLSDSDACFLFLDEGECIFFTWMRVGAFVHHKVKVEFSPLAGPTKIAKESKLCAKKLYAHNMQCFKPKFRC